MNYPLHHDYINEYIEHWERDTYENKAA